MPTQNGVSNGVNNPNHRGADDFDSISGTSPQMMMLDETATANGRHDGLTTDGRDNLAFEDDHDHAQGNGKTNGTKTNGANGTNGTNGHQTPKVASKMTTDGAGGDNVEMVPLNPAAVNNHNKNHHPHNNKSTNGASKTPSKDGKTQLDMTNNDYFRPVNNKRKLFRGQKLYVTSDQRSNSRRWKWIAFWGGVFTFVAAALLTGILAATGIIMSKTTPTYAPPTSNESTAMGWNSTLSSTEIPISQDELTTMKVNATIESFTLPTTLPSGGAISTNVTDSTTLEGHPIAVSDHPTVVQTQSTPQPEINTPLVTLNMTSVSFAVVPTVVTTAAAIPVEANETGAIVPTVDDRGRSLPVESEVPHVESETLFPPMGPIFTEEENTTISIIPTVPVHSDNSSLEPALFNDTDLLNSSQFTELPPFDSPVTDGAPENETDQINVTHPPLSSPIQPFDTVPTDPTFMNSTIGLWNNTIIDHNIDEMDSSISNDSLSANDTDVLEGKTGVVNVTEPSTLQHEVNVTDPITHKPDINDSSAHLDREEVPIHVDVSTTNSNMSDVANATILASTTTELPNLNVTNQATSSFEIKSSDSDVSNDTADNTTLLTTVDISSALPTSSMVDEGEEPSNETLHAIVPTVSTSAVFNSSDSSALADNVTGTSSTWSQIGNLTTVGTTLFDQTEMNTMANFTTAEQENSTVSASTL